MKTFLEWLNKGLYNEVDWDNDFSDVHVTCEDPEKIVAYLNDVRANKDVDYGKREKFADSV